MTRNLETLQKSILSAKAIIFDMDGTLIDLEKLNYTTYAHVIKDSFDLNLSQEDYHKYFSGTKTAYGFESYLKSRDISSKNIEQLVKDFREVKRFNLIHNISNTVSIKEGAKDFLEKLFNLKIPLALATSTIKEFTDIILNHFDIGKYFSLILTAEDVTKGKPDPFIYNLALERLSVLKENAIVFEDSLSGIQSAKTAGIFCVGVWDKNWNASSVNGADVIVEDFRGIQF